MRDGSDYLTEQVRLYAVTGERQYMEAYFKEKNITKRREKGLEELEKYESSQSTEYLQKALDSSNNLTNLEYYSMRLISEAHGLDIKSLPEEIQQVELLEEDKNLSLDIEMQKN